MAEVIQIESNGGPQVLALHTVSLPDPAADEVLIRHDAIGLNFIDVYHRTGLYPQSLPCGLGLEAAGVVEAVGSDVSLLRPGDRVGYFMGPIGAYASHRLMKAEALTRLPDDIDSETVAALLLKGCTAEFLVRRCAPARAGDTVLVHAAAGGVGLILGEWLNALGVTAVGTVSTDAKAALARAHGYAHVLVGGDIAAQVKEITGGKGVPIVYDGVGKDSWQASLDSAALRGTIVSFGNASGPVTGVSIGALGPKCLYVTRPSLFGYCATPRERQESSAALFAMIRSGKVRASIGQRYRLADAAQAHRDLEARKTIGSTLLIP